jgi:hypothetical protein
VVVAAQLGLAVCTHGESALRRGERESELFRPRTGVYVPVVEPGMPTDVSKKNKPTFTFRIGSIPRTPPMQAEALEPAAELVVDGE